ncbi:MAG: HEAT repeat domain-containing protein [Thermoguttaceae bacterium]
MHRFRYVWIAWGMVAAVGLPSAWGQTHSKEIMALGPDRLVEILKDPAAPLFDKAKACQRLAVVGTREAIPALVALLPDEKLNLYARFALEAIPDPAVDEALRQAAARLQGRQLVGLIDSIGQRQDKAAVGLLTRLLDSAETPVASAAAGALGRIATPEAASVLKQALAKQSPVKTWVADGCLACADALASAGNRAEALSLYQAVAQADLPRHLKVGALGGQFRLLKGQAKDLLVAQICSEDQALFNLGLAAARQVPGPEVTAALASQLDKLPSERQALLLRAMGDRTDRAPLPAVLAATNSPSPAVRQAAIRVLAKLGDASALGVLLDAALGDGELAQVAREGLKAMAGPEVDQAITARLKQADAKAKAALLDLAGARRIAAARPVVRQALADADPQVQLAAIAALGQLVELKDLDLVLNLALGDPASKQTQAARAALRTAALRMADREACAARLAESLKGTSPANQVYLLELLGTLSGQKALQTVLASARSADPSLKDAATRVLGDWATPDAAPALLEIAQSDPDSKYRVRALRGYIRIARQFGLPEAERLAMCRQALRVAQRDEEKRLALEVLPRIPSREALSLAVEQLDTPALKEDAADAAVKIAQKIRASEPAAVSEAMQKVLKVTANEELAKRAKALVRSSRKKAARK